MGSGMEKVEETHSHCQPSKPATPFKFLYKDACKMPKKKFPATP